MIGKREAVHSVDSSSLAKGKRIQIEFRPQFEYKHSWGKRRWLLLLRRGTFTTSTISVQPEALKKENTP